MACDCWRPDGPASPLLALAGHQTADDSAARLPASAVSLRAFPGPRWSDGRLIPIFRMPLPRALRRRRVAGAPAVLSVFRVWIASAFKRFLPCSGAAGDGGIAALAGIGAPGWVARDVTAGSGRESATVLCSCWENVMA